MAQTIFGRFDGKVILPEENLDFPPNARLRLVIEAATEPDFSEYPFLRTARAQKLQGPTDFSGRIHDYLYGGLDDEP